MQLPNLGGFCNTRANNLGYISERLEEAQGMHVTRESCT